MASKRADALDPDECVDVLRIFAGTKALIPADASALVVRLPKGGASAIFRDADGHVLEGRQSSVTLPQELGDLVAALATAAFNRVPKDAAVALLDDLAADIVRVAMLIDPERSYIGLSLTEQSGKPITFLSGLYLRPEQVH